MKKAFLVLSVALTLNASGFASPVDQPNCKLDLYKPISSSSILKAPQRHSVEQQNAFILDQKSNTISKSHTSNYPGRNIVNWRFSGPSLIGNDLTWFDRNGFWYKSEKPNDPLSFIDAQEENLARNYSTESGLSSEIERSALAKSHNIQLVKGDYFLRSGTEDEEVVVQSASEDSTHTVSDWVSVSDWLVDFDDSLWRIAEIGSDRRVLQCRKDREWRTVTSFSSPAQLINVRVSQSQFFSARRSYVLERKNRLSSVTADGKLKRNAAAYAYAALPVCGQSFDFAEDSDDIGEIIYSFESETLHAVYSEDYSRLSTDDVRLRIISMWGNWLELGSIDSVAIHERNDLWNIVFSFVNEDAMRSIRNEGGVQHDLLCASEPTK